MVRSFNSASAGEAGKASEILVATTGGNVSFSQGKYRQTTCFRVGPIFRHQTFLTSPAVGQNGWFRR